MNGRGYFDGLLWSSFFVPWVSDSNLTVRVSALSRPLTDIKARLTPLWWTLWPPTEDVLRGMYWSGYADAARFFSESPMDPLSMCQCQCRRADDSKDGGDSPTAERSSQWGKFQAAQKLMSSRAGPAGSKMPTADPVTGEDVDEMMR